MTRHYELPSPLLRSLVESVNALINNNNGATGNPEFTLPLEPWCKAIQGKRLLQIEIPFGMNVSMKQFVKG